MTKLEQIHKTQCCRLKKCRTSIEASRLNTTLRIPAARGDANWQHWI